MFKLPQGAQIREVSEVAKPKYKSDPKSIRPEVVDAKVYKLCLLYTSPSPRD